jgi:dimethylglycine dehydrogenase
MATLVGPAPACTTCGWAEGSAFGITAAGGTGYYLAQMMVKGGAEIDMASLDPKRYGWDDNRMGRSQERGSLPTSTFISYTTWTKSAPPPCAPRPRLIGVRSSRRALAVNGWERSTTLAPWTHRKA